MANPKHHLNPSAFALVLESIMDQAHSYCLIESRTTPDRYYKVRLYLTCECEGFKYRGHCQHTTLSLGQEVQWTTLYV